MAGGVHEFADNKNIMIIRTENGRQVSVRVQLQGREEGQEPEAEHRAEAGRHRHRSVVMMFTVIDRHVASDALRRMLTRGLPLMAASRRRPLSSRPDSRRRGLGRGPVVASSRRQPRSAGHTADSSGADRSDDTPVADARRVDLWRLRRQRRAAGITGPAQRRRAVPAEAALRRRRRDAGIRAREDRPSARRSISAAACRSRLLLRQ